MKPKPGSLPFKPRLNSLTWQLNELLPGFNKHPKGSVTTIPRFEPGMTGEVILHKGADTDVIKINPPAKRKKFKWLVIIAGDNMP